MIKFFKRREPLILLALIFIVLKSYAQDPIATERPTQSIGHLVLPANSFQFEQGFTYKDTLELDGFFRLGVSDIGEIRLLTYYDSPQVTVGVKVKLLKARDYRPGIAIRIEMTDFQVSDYRFVYDQKISDKFHGPMQNSAHRMKIQILRNKHQRLYIYSPVWALCVYLCGILAQNNFH